jgi:hypothetical protein
LQQVVGVTKQLREPRGANEHVRVVGKGKNKTQLHPVSCMSLRARLALCDGVLRLVICLINSRQAGKRMRERKKSDVLRRDGSRSSSHRASAPPRVKGPNCPVFDTEGWRIVVIVGFATCRITRVGAFGIQWYLRADPSFYEMAWLQSLVHTFSNRQQPPSGAQLRSKRNMRALNRMKQIR